MKNDKMLKPKDFSAAMERLKVFSQNLEYDKQFEAVKQKTFFNIFSHKVTGEELNEQLTTIQNHFIHLSEVLKKFNQELNDVYHTFEALDKEYIQAILISQKEIEKTSESIKKDQIRIKKLTEDQNRILKGLKKFQEKIDSYSHLKDIDNLWRSVQVHHKEFLTLVHSVELYGKSVESIKASLLKQTENVEKMVLFIGTLKKIVHLHDVDELWDANLLHSDKLVALEKSNEETNARIAQNKKHSDEALKELTEKEQNTYGLATKNRNHLEDLEQYKQQLMLIEHLHDVDELWAARKHHSDKLSTLENRNAETNARIAQNRKYTDEALKKLTEKEQNTYELATNNQNHLEDLEQFRQQLFRIEHLHDVDDLWDARQHHSDKLVRLEKSNEETNARIVQNRKHTDEILKGLTEKGQNTYKLATKNQNHLEDLEQFRQQLFRIEHLHDVDELWTARQHHSNKLATLEKNNEETNETIAKNKKLSDEAIAELDMKGDISTQILTKRIRYISIVAGTSLSLFVIQLLYIIVRLYVGQL